MMDDSMHREQLRPSLLTANLWYLLAAAGLLMMSIIGMTLTHLPAFEAHKDVLSRFLNVFYEISLLALPAAIYALHRRPTARSMRLNRPKAKMLLYAAALAAVGVFMANLLTSWWLLLIEFLGGTPQSSGIAVPTTGSELMISLVVIGMIPGVCEEMLFRGGMMSAWEGFGKKTALIATSVLFALLHGTIAGLPNQLLMGLILGYIVIATDSVFVGMVYHAVHNSVTMLLAYLSSSALPAAELEAAASLSLAESMGGAVGYISLAASTAVMCILFSVLFGSMMRCAKRSGIFCTLSDDAPPAVLKLVDLVPLFLALTVAAFNYAADFIATFCG